MTCVTSWLEYTRQEWIFCVLLWRAGVNAKVSGWKVVEVEGN